MARSRKSIDHRRALGILQHWLSSRTSDGIQRWLVIWPAIPSPFDDERAADAVSPARVLRRAG